jgi:16S rRNA G527 N7-methylase RsmG
MTAGLAALGLTEPFVNSSVVVRLLGRFAELLSTDALRLGLIGPRETNRLLDRHLLDSAALFPLIARDGVLIDVGSGAGLPGLVLAILQSSVIDTGIAEGLEAAELVDEGEAGVQVHGDPAPGSSPEPRRPDGERGNRGESVAVGHGSRESWPSTRFVASEAPLPVSEHFAEPGGGGVTPRRTILLEPKAKAAAFLRSAVRELGVEADVLEDSSESTARTNARESAQAVVARAVAPPSVALELTLPLTRIGGRVLIPIGDLDRADLDGATEAAAELGGSEPTLVRLEVPGAEAGRWVMIIEKARSTPDRYPRRPSALRRRPLGGSSVT